MWRREENSSIYWINARPKVHHSENRRDLQDKVKFIIIEKYNKTITGSREITAWKKSILSRSRTKLEITVMDWRP